MKKITTIFFLCFITFSSYAQLQVGLAGNYTMYKGDFQRSTPGALLRIGYESDRTTVFLGFNYGLAIKDPSYVNPYDNMGNSIQVPSNIKYNFKTFSLGVNRRLIGDEETTAGFYISTGLSYVLVNFKEDVTGSYDRNRYTHLDNQLEKSKESGFTLNFGIGGEYRLGTPVLFGEAGLSLPANQANNVYIENVIPAHFTFNIGVKIPLGGNNDY